MAEDMAKELAKRIVEFISEGDYYSHYYRNDMPESLENDLGEFLRRFDLEKETVNG